MSRPCPYYTCLCYVLFVWFEEKVEEKEEYKLYTYLFIHGSTGWEMRRDFTWFHNCLVVYWVLFRFDVVFDIIHGTMWDTEVTLAVTAVRIVFTFLSTGFQKRTFWFPLHFVFTVMATFTASWFGLFGPWRRQRWHFTSTSSQQLQKSEHMWEKPTQTGNSKIDLSKRH